MPSADPPDLAPSAGSVPPPGLGLPPDLAMSAGLAPPPDLAPRVAVVGPLSGPRAAWGQLLVEAVAAVPDAVARWELFDDLGDVAEAVARAAEIVADGGFAAVVGHFNSLGARAALPVYAAAGVPVLLPLATAPGLLAGTPGGALRLCPDDAGQATVIVGACLAARQRRLTAVHDGSGYGLGLAERVLAAGGTDLTVRISAGWPAEPIDGAVALCGVHHGVAELLRGWERPETVGPVIAVDDCAVPEFAELAGPGATGVSVATLAGGAYGRVVAAVGALANALTKHPRHRGTVLLDAVRGELPGQWGPDGDPIGVSSGQGWQITPVRASHRRPDVHSGVDSGVPNGAPNGVHSGAGPDRYDVAVVGGGVVGRAAAAVIAEAGVRVALLDPGTPGSSASTVSGALVRAFELDPVDRRRALRAYQLLWGRAELARAHGFRRTGALVLLRAGDLDAAGAGIDELGSGGVAAELLTAREVALRWPDLDATGLAGAVWEPGAGYVMSVLALAVLLDRARRAGAATLPARVRAVTADPEGVVVLADGPVPAGGPVPASRTVRASVVVVAAGCATPGLLGERWPADRPARTKRIQYAIFAAPGRRLPTIVDLTTGVWGRPDGGAGFLAGRPVDEWDVPATAGTSLTAGQVEWIRTGAGSRLPFLSTADLLAGRYGADLYLPGGPLLGALPGTTRTVVAAGWSGTGFKTAPAAAEELAAATFTLLGTSPAT